MRGPLVRPGLPLLVLLVAVLAHASLGAIVDCDLFEGSRTTPIGVAVATAPVPNVGACVDCTGAADSEVDVATASAQPVGASTAPSPARAHDACTSEQPCHDTPANEHGPTEATVRAIDTSPHSAPAVLPVCTLPHRPDRSAPADTAVAPLSATTLDPVAVLCVDRN